MAMVTACDKTLALLSNVIPVDWGRGPLIIHDEVTAMWLGETQNLKW